MAGTMGSATFSIVAFSVLATPLREEFDAARWQIGALVTSVMAVGALVSPHAGTISDRWAPRRSVALTLMLAGIAFLAMSVSPWYLLVAGAAGISGVGQAMANPATNRLIMSLAETGKRGLLTGVKQAGVQAGNFLGGLLLPVGAAALGWRPTLALVALVPAVSLAILPALPAGGAVAKPPRADAAPRERTSPVMLRLAVYAALLGAAGASLLTYIPSFAQEAFGLDTAAGGGLVALFGGVGFLARLTAGSLSERYFGHHRTLVGMAVITALAGAGVAAAPTSAWLWPVAVLIGLGPMAWNVIANLAVMELSPKGAAGRGSGVMMAGFLGGMAVGAPLMGGSVDLLGTYRPGWWAVAVLGLAAAVVGRRVRADRYDAPVDVLP